MEPQSQARFVEENGRNHRTILWFHVSLQESIQLQFSFRKDS